MAANENRRLFCVELKTTRVVDGLTHVFVIWMTCDDAQYEPFGNFHLSCIVIAIHGTIPTALFSLRDSDTDVICLINRRTFSTTIDYKSIWKLLKQTWIKQLSFGNVNIK